MSKKEANLTAIVIVQQLDESYWHWDDTSPVKKAREGDCKQLLEEITKRLEENEIKVKECYGIVHDKDKRTIWDEVQMKNVIEDKEIHIHVLLKFEKGAPLKKLAVSIGVEPQYLQKLKSGRYGYDNSLSYLVHAKEEKKHRYNPKEVITLLGENYESIYNRRIDVWENGQAKKDINNTSDIKDLLVLAILKGNITKDNLLLSDKYYVVYARYKRLFNEAFDTYYEQKSLKSIEDIENGKFKKTIIFISGASGVGKTRFAKEIIHVLKLTSLKYTGKIWERCITAATNAFDEYYSQEILFLDDIRGNSLSLVDWLKLLDPFSISPISARYHNKQAVAKTIIITSPHHPREFFRTVENVGLEDFDQFYRRIDMYVKIEDNFSISYVEKKELTKEDKKKEHYKDNNKKYKYIFTKGEIYEKPVIVDKILKKIITNMNWNKKELSEHTDQSK